MGKIPVLFLQSQAQMGADSVIHAHIMRHLDRSEFEVHAACNSGDSGEEPPSLSAIALIPDTRVRPTRFAPRTSASFRGSALEMARAAGTAAWDFAALVRYVKQHGIRIVHSSDRRRDSTLAIALSKATGARSVLHVHVKWSGEYGATARWAMRNADAAFGISRFVSETIIAEGKPRNQVFTVLNAVDPERWQPNIDGSGVRREFGVSAETPLLASVSRLFSWKGQRALVQALALVKRERPDVRLLIVGRDETEVHGGSFTAELQRLAHELGVSENVIFTGARSDVPEIMAAADLFTMPSFEEPFGLVFLEAMAMQKPVIALNNGGTPEVVEHGRTGLLSEPGDLAELAANILALLADPGRRSSMGESGRQVVLERFRPERLAADVAAAYRVLLH